MPIFYTDIALCQQLGNNFPGAPGQAQIGQPPFYQNYALCEGPPTIVAIYTVSSGATEAVGDTINIAKGEEGWLVEPTGRVSTGVTAPAATLTIGVGDNDLGLLTARPVASAAGAQATVGQTTSIQAPAWVSGTAYVPGNVVVDNAASSGIFVTGDTYTCVAATSGTTAPHSAATTVWQPNYLRYSGSIDVHAALTTTSFAGGIQSYGGPASILPFAVTPGSVPTGLTAAQIANLPYILQSDCWIQARILTVGTLVASTILVFRIGVIASN